MSDSSNRSPVTVNSSELKYDESLTRRRSTIMLVSTIGGVIIIIVCLCMACSVYSWVQSILTRLFSGQ